MIAALFVATGGVYFGLPDVDPWDERRDARLYAGPWPVVAHPPCQRWGRYWSGGPMLAQTTKAKRKGDDGGCFAAALAAVRAWGGVLEHPEGSHAWRAFDLNTPPKDGAWVNGDLAGGWTCCVEQGHYGHRARKATWLYAYAVAPPTLKWRSSGRRARIDDGFHTAEERRAFMKRRAWLESYACETGRELVCAERLSKSERLRTPLAFRDLLLTIAMTATLACATTPPPVPPPPVLAPLIDVETLLPPPPGPLVIPAGLPRYMDIPIRSRRFPGLPPGILVSEPAYAEIHAALGTAVRMRKEADALAQLRVDERAAAEELLATQQAHLVASDRALARERRWAPWRLLAGVVLGAGTMLGASWAAGKAQR